MILTFTGMATCSVGPPPNPPSPQRLWLGQAGQSLTSPQSMVSFPGDFLGEILALPSKCLGSVQTSLQTILANNPRRNPRTKIGQKPGKNLCRKSVQKSVQKNPCNKSVQKMRAESRAKNLCRTNPCKRLPQSNVAN